jgi:hypothetical protein
VGCGPSLFGLIVPPSEQKVSGKHAPCVPPSVNHSFPSLPRPDILFWIKSPTNQWRCFHEKQTFGSRFRFDLGGERVGWRGTGDGNLHASVVDRHHFVLN